MAMDRVRPRGGRGADLPRRPISGPIAKGRTGPRRVALDTLDATLGRRPKPADEALVGHPAFEDLDRRDRAFARLLVLTVLRRLGELDALARPHLRFEPKDLRARNILRLGTAQLRFLGTPAHAAVNETVRLAVGKQAPMVPMLNAVLRRVADAPPVELDAARLDTPSWLFNSWTAAYGEPAARAIAAAHLAEAPLDLVVKGDPAPWVEALDGRLLPGGTLRCPGGGPIDQLPGFAEGAWWVQDLAATFPARLLGDVAGRRVLDLCAAPGGKTMQLAAAGARVTAVEVDADRALVMRANIARVGLEAAVETVVADARAWSPEMPFDLVLLDAPCSATGTIRRHPDILWAKSAEGLARLTGLQDELLLAASRMVAPGGKLAYAVCSLQPEEGPQRIKAFLEREPGFVRDPIGREELLGLPVDLTPEGELRTLPCHLAEEGGMDGFFVARLRRS